MNNTFPTVDKCWFKIITRIIIYEPHVNILNDSRQVAKYTPLQLFII